MPKSKKVKTAPDSWIVNSGPANASLNSSDDYSAVLVGENGTAKVVAHQSIAAALVGGIAHCVDRVALAGDSGVANVGDGAVAVTGLSGYAQSELYSMAFSNSGGWARSLETGIAFAIGGLAETIGTGVAIVTAKIDPGGSPQYARGIARAGPGGIAIALGEGNLVLAGDKGLLVGWDNSGGTNLTTASPVSSASATKPNQLYLFKMGKFLPLTDQQLIKANKDIAAWKATGLKEPIARLSRPRR